MKSPLDLFVSPRAIAIVGASRTPGRAGYVLVKNISQHYREGRVFPVNPAAQEILGLPCYAHLQNLPEPPDIVVISLPPRETPPVIEEAGKAGARGIIVVGSGYAEEGEEGRRLELEMVRQARLSGLRILGPNTTGLLNTEKDLLLTFLDFDEVRKGSVSFIVQSGTFGGGLLEQIRSSYFFGIAKSFGMGNKCDLADEDALDFLEEDGQTRVVAIHMEGTKNGRAFFERAKKVTPQKPVILLKSGRTPFGARAMLSHTASLAGNDALFTAACRQAGIIRVESIEEFFDTIKIFATQPLPWGRRVAIVTFSGAAGVMGADVLYEEDLALASLTPETIHSVQEAGPAWHRIGNPVDIWPTEMEIGNERAYELATRAALKDPGVDALIIVHSAMGESKTPFKGFTLFPKFKDEFPSKPLLSVLHGNCQFMEQVRVFLESNGIPSYPSIDRAVRALSHLYRYTLHRETHERGKGS